MIFPVVSPSRSVVKTCRRIQKVRVSSDRGWAQQNANQKGTQKFDGIVTACVEPSEKYMMQRAS